MGGLSRDKTSILVGLGLIILLFANFAFWFQSRHVITKWDRVPPPPGVGTAAFSAAGDTGAAYRMFAYFLQNFGNTGGEFVSLKRYDYALLVKWFELTRALDPHSDFVPFMAAYYFGAVEGDKERVRHIVDYLAEEGAEPYPEKWRWLAQAVYLARYKLEDQELALTLANRVAALPGKVAPWARQLPAFVELNMGNKEAAYQIMVSMLASEGDKLHPNEVNAMRDFICTRTLSRQEAEKNPLCAPEK